MSEPGDHHPSGAVASVGGFERDGVVVVLGVFGAIGAGLGGLLPFLAGWVAEWPWVPFRGPLDLLASFDAAWLTWGRPLLGLLIGLAIAGWVVHNSPVLRMTDSEIHVVRHGDVQRVIRRDQVDGVYRDGSKVVIESEKGRTLFEDEVEGDKSSIRDTFVRHGYPWEGDRG